MYEQIEVQTILCRLGLRHPLKGQRDSVAAQGDVPAIRPSTCSPAAACQKSASRSKSQQSRVNSMSTPTLCATRRFAKRAELPLMGRRVRRPEVPMVAPIAEGSAA
jgi:hypothetical protein